MLVRKLLIVGILLHPILVLDTLYHGTIFVNTRESHVPETGFTEPLMSATRLRRLPLRLLRFGGAPRREMGLAKIEPFLPQRIILIISKSRGGINKDKNRITGRLAPVIPAIKPITLAATI